MKVEIFMDGKEVVDVRRVRNASGLSNDKLYELLRYGKFIKPFKYKNQNYWYKDAIEEYVKKAKKQGR